MAQTANFRKLGAHVEKKRMYEFVRDMRATTATAAVATDPSLVQLYGRFGAKRTQY